MIYKVRVRCEWEGEVTIETDNPEDIEGVICEEDPSCDQWEGDWTKQILETYEWNDAAQKKFQEETDKTLNRKREMMH